MTFLWSTQTPAARLLYGQFDPVSDRDAPSVSAGHSIGFTFTRNSDSYVRLLNGRTERRDVARGTGGMASAEPIEWIEVKDPFEVVEMTVAGDVRTEMAEELRPTTGTDFADVYNQNDPVLWTVANRVRAAALSGNGLGQLEVDMLTRAAVAHMMFEHLGAERPRLNARPFDRARLDRLVDYIDANLDQTLGLRELAGVAALSPHHFLRSFRAATGVTPHAYVAARRMERALQVIRTGISIGAAARAVGYADNHSFRRQFRRYVGVSPSKIP